MLICKIKSNIKFNPILNPEYTNIELQGQIWYSTTSNKPSRSNSSSSPGTQSVSDLSYIYFLTNHNDIWWFSISKNNPENIKMINDTRISEYKNLAYIMYASYPFIECNLK